MKNILVAIILLQTTVLFSQTRNSVDDGRKIKIPIVFHVIYNNDSENISDRLILNELQDLNLNFTQKNDMSLLDNDFRNLVGNPNIEFNLLDTIFQKNGKKGIRRISSKQLEKRNKLLIDPSNCLNVFIAKQGNASDILSDRVHLNYKSVGMSSHVLTHETGHWMGLYHIFGQIGNSSWLRVTFGNRNDLIDDTPKQKGATAVCYSITPKCPCPPKKTHYRGHKTLYNNFMDYNPCRCMFTIGQSIKMRNNIIEHKRILFDNSKYPNASLKASGGKDYQQNQ
ncbi:M43 family zinc metalloprotease [Flavivirga amylovorans]|uniref:M43 family zinc metalloprotease n=1 Tax=Flavivirga amylovorans TaxID=870486 RepID=A0ABT8WYR3_9FLAO|nr:M43 family zinc metalloprotease [Flavivirga amylovorans]MDO5986819.1 M43 family zinc metalloprotease [Flavivirga amylovorans]